MFSSPPTIIIFQTFTGARNFIAWKCSKNNMKSENFPSRRTFSMSGAGISPMNLWNQFQYCKNTSEFLPSASPRATTMDYHFFSKQQSHFFFANKPKKCPTKVWIPFFHTFNKEKKEKNCCHNIPYILFGFSPCQWVYPFLGKQSQVLQMISIVYWFFFGEDGKTHSLNNFSPALLKSLCLSNLSAEANNASENLGPLQSFVNNNRRKMRGSYDSTTINSQPLLYSLR